MELHPNNLKSRVGVLVPHESHHSKKKTHIIKKQNIYIYLQTPHPMSVCCGVGGLTQVHAADPIGITCAAPVGTAVLLNGWQHSGPVRPSRRHAGEPVLWSPTSCCAARCMARKSLGSLVGGVACAEYSDVPCRARTGRRCVAPDALAILCAACRCSP